MPFSPATPLDRAVLALIVVAAAALRLAWHAVAPDVDWPDTAVYIETGRALVETGQMSSTRYMPLYQAAEKPTGR